MQSFTAYDAKGRILWNGVISGKSDIHRQASPDLGVSIVRGRHDAKTKWIDGGEIKDRPELDLPDHIVVNLSDNEVEFPDIPEETVVRYDKMEAGVADAEGITLSFDEAGKWEIYFDPPFPYQPAIIEAEVEDD